jgi:hypothetical protein
MSPRAQALAEKIQAFNRDFLDCVQNCSDADWQKTCPAEDWPVGVVIRHVAEGHYGVKALAQMIIKGDPLPELTMEAVIQMGNAHAREHADCTREEVRTLLEQNGRALVEFIANLTEDELDCQGQMALLGGDVSAQQILEMLILHSGGDHLSSVRSTLSG